MLGLSASIESVLSAAIYIIWFTSYNRYFYNFTVYYLPNFQLIAVTVRWNVHSSGSTPALLLSQLSQSLTAWLYDCLVTDFILSVKTE